MDSIDKENMWKAYWKDKMDEMIRYSMWEIAKLMVDNSCARKDPYAVGYYDKAVELLKATDDGYSKGEPYNLPWYFAASMKWHPEVGDTPKGHVVSCFA